jgi:S-layer homology domain.
MKKIFLAVFFCTIFLSKNIYAQQINYGSDKTISRAQIAKMLAFMYCDKNEIIDLYNSRNINFSDTDATKWYDKYINAVYNKKLMSGTENKFEPQNPLTLIQAQYLLDKINPSNTIKIKITDENKNKNISYSLWVKLFMDTIKDLDTKITQKKIITLATSLQNKKILQNYIITSENYFSIEGIDFDFIDKETQILCNENEIISVLSYSDEFELKNCSILKNRGNKIYVECPPVKRFFNTKLQKKISAGIFNLKIKSGEIIDISTGEK